MRQEIRDVHSELQPLVKRFPNLTFSRRNLWLFHVLGKLYFPGKTPTDISIENIHISQHNESSKIRLRVYRSRSISLRAPALLWIHGGGYILGTPEQNDQNCIQYARETGAVVFSVDYRFAPAHPFPAPLEDCYAALTWIMANAQQWSVDPDRIAIGGESAGGGLAAALAQLVMDRKEAKPIFQLLIYPMLDDRTVVRNDLLNRNYFVWNQESNRFGWESYLGRQCGAADVPPYSVPARRADLSSLPPAWIGVGTLDLFHDEAVTYAHRLTECGVTCELKVVQGAFHGFDIAGPQLKVVREFRQSQVDVLKKYFN